MPKRDKRKLRRALFIQVTLLVMLVCMELTSAFLGRPADELLWRLRYFLVGLAVVTVLVVLFLDKFSGIFLSLGERRVDRGLCPKCGYDIRATPKRCPECGYSATDILKYKYDKKNVNDPK